MDEALEVVRLRGPLTVGAFPARLETECEVLARDNARVRPRAVDAGSPVPVPMASPSSDLILRMVDTEFTEMRRLRFIVIEISKSSVRCPWLLNCDCSAGWESAEASASRTGNGVKLRTWTDEMWRMRLGM